MNPTTHKEQLDRLNRIEGQVKGIIKMVGEGRYCIDILTQLNSVISALSRVQDNVLAKHVEGCVMTAAKRGTQTEQVNKIAEILNILKNFRR